MIVARGTISASCERFAVSRQWLAVHHGSRTVHRGAFAVHHR